MRIYNNKILKNIKIKKRINNNISPPKAKKIKRKISDDESSLESDLDIISEENKSININKTINNEQEEKDYNSEEEKNYKNNDDNKIVNSNKSNNIKEILTAPIAINLSGSGLEREEKINEIRDADEENNLNGQEEITEEKNEEEINKKKEEEENNKGSNNESNSGENKENETENSKDDKKGSNKKKELKYLMKPKKSEKQDISIFQTDEYNQQLMLKKLRGKKRKSKLIKPSIYSFLLDLKNKKIIPSKNKEVPANKPHVRKYFKNVDINSLQEINKRKIELLFRIKHDLEFKIHKGYIKSLDKLEFKDLEQKINSTKIQTFDKNGIDEYLDKLEGFFNAFENDITIAENSKKEEERINGFRNDLIERMSFSEILREKREKIFANVIDFIDINHINELSGIDI